MNLQASQLPNASGLALPLAPPMPLVSIVMPVYNQVDFTIRCLKSIQDKPSKASVEVIVLDDSSHDETPKILPGIPGIRYIRNEGNLGFLLSCNRAASEARGDYLIFLNNNTEVQKDWLDYMLAVFERCELVGIVGPKVIYPNGRLHEAGGLIWRDGSATNFGWNDDPLKPEYNYVRETDYCSAVCIMIKAALFNGLEGFDELFASAHYEATDLSFKVRQSGYKVLYQPAAHVIYFEGGTYGTDLNSGVKSYQQLNAKKFAAKWAPVLLEHYPAQNQDLVLTRDRRVIGRCLFVDFWPIPDRDAGSFYTTYLFQLFQHFSYKVTFFPGNTTHHFGKYTDELQQMGIECLYEPFVTSLEKYLELNGHYFDVVVLSRAPLAISYFDAVRLCCARAKIIFHTVDLYFLREERAARVKNSVEDLKGAQQSKEDELKICGKADCTLVASIAEASLLAKEVPDAYVEWFPFSSSLPGRKKNFDARRNIAFVASYLHEPNVDAVMYFVRELWPSIAERLPHVQFLIVGSNMPESVSALASDRIKAIGYVEDLTQFLENCRLTVAPLRYVAGIKGKVISSLAHGVPVVASSLAVEGMGCEQGVHLLVADTIAEWTECVARAYTNKDLWEYLSDNGLALMRDTYSIEAGVPRLQALLHRLECPLPSGQKGLEIVFVSHDAANGGAQRVLITLIEWLRDKKAVQPKIVLRHGGPLTPEFYRLGPVLEMDLLASFGVKRSREELVRFCGDSNSLVYVNTLVPGDVAEQLSKLQIPIITHAHELENAIKRWCVKEHLETLIKLTNHFIAASPPVARNLETAHDVDPGRITTIYANIRCQNHDAAGLDKLALRKRKGLPESGLIIFGCGTTDWRKGADLFIEVASHADGLGLENYYFFWIGADTGERGQLETKVRELALESRVRFLGEFRDTRSYFAAGDVFLLTSREDPFPLVCLEAADCSLPIVCFDKAGGMPDFVQNDAGYVVPFADTKGMAKKLMALCVNPEERARRGAIACQRVRARHDISITGEEIFRIIDYFTIKQGSHLPIQQRPVSQRAGVSSTPKVSVIVPNYNHAPYLRQRLDSIINQEFQDLEVIVLDDASNDNSKEIIQTYVHHPGFRFLFNETRSGSAFKQWKKGLEEARGEYIWFAESDDYASPHFLSKLIPILESDKSIGLVYSQSYLVDLENRILGDALQWTDDLDPYRWKSDFVNDGVAEIKSYLSKKNTIPNASAVLIRASVLQSIDYIDDTHNLCGDWLLWIKLLLQSNVGYVAEKLNYWRQSSSHARLHPPGILEWKEGQEVLKYLAKELGLSEAERDKIFLDFLRRCCEWIGEKNKHLAAYTDSNQFASLIHRGFLDLLDLAACELAAQRWGVSPEIHPKDFIFRFLCEHPALSNEKAIEHYSKAIEHYFNDGQQSAQTLRKLLSDVCGLEGKPVELLEFASGYGCVTRHLRSVIPLCVPIACDIHQEAVVFIADHLGVPAVLSTPQPEALRIAKVFDVVFALSFFSHMPKSSFSRWLRKLASLTKPEGVLIFTTHGRVSQKYFPSCQFDADGFYFLPTSEQKDLSTEEYGSSVVTPDYVLRQLFEIPALTLTYFQEGYWWKHQDIYVVRLGSLHALL